MREGKALAQSGNIQLAVVSGLLRLYPLDLALKLIKEAGYDGVELWGGQYHGYVWDLVEEQDGEFRLDRSRVQAIRQLCDHHGLAIAGYTPEQLIYPINILVDQVPPFDGSALREKSRRNLELCIDIAEELGTKRMALIAPMWQWIAEGDGYRRPTRKEVLSAAVSEVAHFVDYAAARDTTILFEPLVYHDSNGIATFEEAAMIFDQIDSPNLQIMLDFGHIAVTAKREGCDPVDYLEAHLDRFGDRVGHIHVDDNNFETDAHLAPGTGSIDLQGMTDAVVASGYSGWMSVELSVLGPYALPENAERLLIESREATGRMLMLAGR